MRDRLLNMLLAIVVIAVLFDLIFDASGSRARVRGMAEALMSVRGQ